MNQLVITCCLLAVVISITSARSHHVHRTNSHTERDFKGIFLGSSEHSKRKMLNHETREEEQPCGAVYKCYATLKDDLDNLYDPSNYGTMEKCHALIDSVSQCVKNCGDNGDMCKCPAQSRVGLFGGALSVINGAKKMGCVGFESGIENCSDKMIECYSPCTSGNPSDGQKCDQCMSELKDELVSGSTCPMVQILLNKKADDDFVKPIIQAYYNGCSFGDMAKCQVDYDSMDCSSQSQVEQGQQTAKTCLNELGRSDSKCAPLKKMTDYTNIENAMSSCTSAQQAQDLSRCTEKKSMKDRKRLLLKLRQFITL